MRLILLFDLFLAMGVGICIWDLFDEKEEIVQIIDPYDAQYSVAKTHYKWVTPRIFKTVYDNTQDLPVKDAPFLILALIQAESEGNPRAIGPRVKKYHHRARGLMQVMPFWVKRGETYKLHDPVFNIQTGIKIFKKYFHGNVAEALKNYNSGPASDYYNWKYIRKIQAEHNKMSLMLAGGKK